MTELLKQLINKKEKRKYVNTKIETLEEATLWLLKALLSSSTPEFIGNKTKNTYYLLFSEAFL